MSLVDRAIDLAFGQLKAVGGDWSKLPEPMAVVGRICAAQGVIDNGGLRYFFENDWPGQPPYSTFAAAYRAIGCESEAMAIDKAVMLFAFPCPERDRKQRFDALLGPVGVALDELYSRCQSDVWACLGAYVEQHRGIFEPHG